MLLLFRCSLVVEVEGFTREVIIIVYRIQAVTLSGECAMSSNYSSCGIADPLVRPQREPPPLECVDRECETVDPLPISRVKIKRGTRCKGFREMGMDTDFDCGTWHERKGVHVIITNDGGTDVVETLTIA